jgi:hypothetical protein
LPTKTKLDKLKANVDAQELRLEDGVKMLNEAKKNESETAEKGSESAGFAGANSEWDALERVIGLMDDLLNSYRSYTKELEKSNKSRSRRSGSKTSSQDVEVENKAEI